MNELTVEIEETPNPKAIKFILNHPVKTTGKITYKDTDECKEPLASDMLKIKHVNQVHFFDNVITVSQDGGAEWSDLLPQIEAVILTRFAVHNPDFVTEVPQKKIRDDLPPEVKTIEELLNRTVRPGIQADGRDIEVISYEDDMLTV